MAIDSEVEARLSTADVRYTRGRRQVVSALSRADGPRSAAELHADIGSAVPLSSLYRSLTVLEESHIVVPHLGKRGVIRYELAEWLQGHHHHLVCVDCGSVEDVSVSEEYEERVHDVVSRISESLSFTALNHVLEIEGRCRRCA